MNAPTFSRPDAPAIISAKILTLVSTGMTVQEALDAVCGAGTFEKLASDLYDALREAK